MKKSKVKWTEGDCFLVPLSDGSFSVGQVIKREREALNSVICVFSSIRVFDRTDVDKLEINDDNLISILFVTPDFLNSGVWSVFCNRPVFPILKYVDFSEFERNGFVGVIVIGSGIVRYFLDAIHKLFPWNGMHDPNYFEGLLVSLDRRPKDLIFKHKS